MIGLLKKFNYELAVQTLYDFMTKSRPNQDTDDYDFITDMASKYADNEEPTHQEEQRIRKIYLTRLGT